MVRESKTVVTSRFYEVHLIEILEYGIETFGYAQAKAYFNVSKIRNVRKTRL